MQGSKVQKQKDSPISSERPKSSIPGRFHEWCLDQICTCTNPNHRCPLNYMRKSPCTPKTHYTQAYSGNHEVQTPKSYKHPDNIRLGKELFAQTIYNRDYTFDVPAGVTAVGVPARW